MYGWMNGANSDNVVSIPTMVTQTMATQKVVGQNMITGWLLGTLLPKLLGYISISSISIS